MWRNLKVSLFLFCIAFSVASSAIAMEITAEELQALNRCLQTQREQLQQSKQILEQDKTIILNLKKLMQQREQDLKKNETYILDLEKISKQDKELIITLKGDLVIAKKSCKRLENEAKAYKAAFWVTLASALIYSLSK